MKAAWQFQPLDRHGILILSFEPAIYWNYCQEVFPTARLVWLLVKPLVFQNSLLSLYTGCSDPWRWHGLWNHQPKEYYNFQRKACQTSTASHWSKWVYTQGRAWLHELFSLKLHFKKGQFNSTSIQELKYKCQCQQCNSRLLTFNYVTCLLYFTGFPSFRQLNCSLVVMPLFKETPLWQSESIQDWNFSGVLCWIAWKMCTLFIISRFV
jgi:hypothetical protein